MRSRSTLAKLQNSPPARKRIILAFSTSKSEILKSGKYKINLKEILIRSSCGIIEILIKSHEKKCSTVKLGFKELLNKEQICFKELFTDYQLFYTINLLLNKELLPI